MTKRFLALLLLAGLLQPFCHADEWCFEDEFCGCAGHPYRIEASHIEANGVGYKKGYSSLAAFAAPFTFCSLVPFIDLRAHVFNDGKLAANAGLGVRTLLDTKIYGINGYYDYRKSSHHHYNQVGLGIEVLGRRLEYRLNGYLPVGKKESPAFHRDNSSNPLFDSFRGHDMLISTVSRSKSEFAMKGFDGEVGAVIMKKKHYNAYLGLGPYYYSGPYRKHAVGGRARLTVKAYKYVLLECISTYDSLFHEIVQGRIGVTVPFGPKKPASTSVDIPCCEKALAMNKKLYQDVERQEIIVLKSHRKKRLSKHVSIAIDPTTSQPIHFLFVDNTSSSQGTFESPFSTLIDAQNASHKNDVIYVFPGDGTDKGMNTGIVLKDKQRFLGSNITYLFQTTLGIVTLPPLSASKPVISNTGALTTVVEMANDCQTTGMIINAIYPPTMGLFPGINMENSRNAQINDNVINSASDGIDIIDYEGTINIFNNAITGVPVPLHFSDCIAVISPTSDTNLVTLANNTLLNNDQSGIHIQNLRSHTQFVSVTQNAIANCQEGCLLENNNGGIQATLVQNAITATTDNGTNQPAGVFLQEHNVLPILCTSLIGNVATTTPTIPGYCYFNESPIAANLPLILGLTNIGSILTFPGSLPILPSQQPCQTITTLTPP